MEIGALTKLLNQGHSSTQYVHESEDGSYTFSLSTITPIEEIEASKDAERTTQEAKAGDTNTWNVFYAIEVLARSITTVNDVALQSVPGAEGDSDLDKKRFVIKQVGEKLMIELWKKYNEMRAEITLDGSEEDEEAVKK